MLRPRRSTVAPLLLQVLSYDSGSTRRWTIRTIGARDGCARISRLCELATVTPLGVKASLRDARIWFIFSPHLKQLASRSSMIVSEKRDYIRMPQWSRWKAPTDLRGSTRLTGASWWLASEVLFKSCLGQNSGNLPVDHDSFVFLLKTKTKSVFGTSSIISSCFGWVNNRPWRCSDSQIQNFLLIR